MDLTPLFLSLKTASLATVITFASGTFAAYKVARMRKGKGLIDALLTLPMVLPPTVVGFFLLVFFGKNSMAGAWLTALGFPVVFTFAGTVVAAVVVSFPLMYRTARGAFEQMDFSLVFAAQTLGLGKGTIFFRIIFPNCLPGIIGGVILAFARALGEFGATMMLAGNIPGRTQTAAIAIYTAMQNGNRTLACQWAGIIVLISLAAVLGMNYVNARQELASKRRRQGAWR